MAYNRQPQTVLAGTGLKQNPPSTIISPAGIIPVEIEAEIATTTGLGVVQVGSGLSITPSGILSATGGGSSLINVTLVDDDYSILDTDYYVGATDDNIDLILPLGITGKVYYLKNQTNGNIKIYGTSGQKIDTSSSKTLGSQDGIIVVFDGTRWNVI
jgi:hypothetical protein